MNSQSSDANWSASANDRVIRLGTAQVPVPERLLLAHARGEVLFLAGAGVSQPAGLPDFKGLVLNVYEALDAQTHAIIQDYVNSKRKADELRSSGLNFRQTAEAMRFMQGDYDVVLGMLERRMDERSTGESLLRQTVIKEIRRPNSRPQAIHRALMRIADRGGTTAIVTTNFDLLLEAAAKQVRVPTNTYSLGEIPRPGHGRQFAGVFHIHGCLSRDAAKTSDIVVTDHDFGEFYLRRRIVPDFLYDAARLYHLVLVGYSASDAPMRYLLNSVAADGARFGDLKERFAFVGTKLDDPVVREDWTSRGITPIQYDDEHNHSHLLFALERWAELSAINGKRATIDREVARIVKEARSVASEKDRDLFDHLFRRANLSDRIRMSVLASKRGADLGWLDAMLAISMEGDRERRG